MELSNLLRFCPVCKHDLVNDGRLYTCASCGFHYYTNPTPCNAVILTNGEGHVLMVKRRFEPHKGSWDLPGGFVEMDETLEDSVSRETKEEINADIKDMKYLCSTTDVYEYKGIIYHTICSTYTASLTNDDLKPMDDVESFQYFAPEELPFETIAFESIKKVLKLYLGTLR